MFNQLFRLVLAKLEQVTTARLIHLLAGNTSCKYVPNFFENKQYVYISTAGITECPEYLIEFDEYSAFK